LAWPKFDQFALQEKREENKSLKARKLTKLLLKARTV
jgi:hypothetical protein